MLAAVVRPAAQFQFVFVSYDDELLPETRQDDPQIEVTMKMEMKKAKRSWFLEHEKRLFEGPEK